MSKKYYAVKNGRQIGIFQIWEECKSKQKDFQMQYMLDLRL